jgi:hypothetical protein
MDYTIDKSCQRIESQILVVEDYLDHKFAEAEDVAYGRYLIKQYDRLDAVKKLVFSLKNAYEDILEDEGLRTLSKENSTSINSQQLRKISVVVTDGMIKQNLLTLTKAKKAGLVEEGQFFVIHPDGGDSFETKLLPKGNRLQERGKLAAFYARHKVEGDDHVILEETKKGVWKLYVDELRRKEVDQALNVALEDWI